MSVASLSLYTEVHEITRFSKAKQFCVIQENLRKKLSYLVLEATITNLPLNHTDVIQFIFFL